MGKPSAPDTAHLHLPEPTGRDAHDAPYWRIGPILITVGVIESGPEVGHHGVFVVAFDPLLPGMSTQVAGAILAADRAALAADARDRVAHTRAQEVEAIARDTSPEGLRRALRSAERSGDTESAAIFTDALDWQRDHAKESAALGDHGGIEVQA